MTTVIVTPTPSPSSEEMEQDFMLWSVLVVAIAGIILVNCIFISTVLICMRCRRTKSIRYVYETNPIKKRNGSHGSAYSVRSQGILELNSPDPRRHDYVNVWEDTNMGGGRSREQLETSNQALISPTREGRPDDESVHHESQDTNPHVVCAEEVNSDEEDESYCQNSNLGGNIYFTRHDNSRMSIQSESGISHGVRTDEQGGFSRQRPGSVNTHRGVDIGLHRGNTDPAFSLPINSSPTNRDDFQNSDPGMLPLSIHQIQTPKQDSAANTRFLFALSDVPGFKDPEILGGSSDSLERLKINLPPDIYSSQILRTVRSPGPESECEARADEELENEFFESGPMIVTEIKKSTQSLDRYISLEPAETTGTMTSLDVDDPQYMRVKIIGDDRSYEDTEVLYDQPLVKPITKDLPLPLFDDPGYDKAHYRLSPPSGDSEVFSKERGYDTLAPVESEEETHCPLQEESGLNEEGGVAQSPESDGKEGVHTHPSGNAVCETVAVPEEGNNISEQVAEMEGSLDSLLGYVEEELQELDASSLAEEAL